MKGVLLPETWASQQHKYLKYSGCEPIASKKMTLGQVVPNFTGQALGGEQNLEWSNVERPIFRNFKVTNIKIAKDEFDYFTCKFVFNYYFLN